MVSIEFEVTVNFTTDAAKYKLFKEIGKLFLRARQENGQTDIFALHKAIFG
ncbi:MAG: hypothetical protein WBP46_02290 [Thiolinea sp.]